MYPSYGTCVNERKYMKKKEYVKQLVGSLDHNSSDLQEMILQSHAKYRRTIAESDVSIERILSLWLRVQKTLV